MSPSRMRGRAISRAGAALVGVTLCAAAALAQSPASEQARVEPRLRTALDAAGPDGWVAVGVTLRRDALPKQAAARRGEIASRQQALLDALPAGAFQLRRRYGAIAGMAGFARASAVDALARRDDVRSVYLDGRVWPNLVQGAALIGADDAHALGQTGDGVNVAIFDTGIDADHPDLEDDLVDERCWCADSHPSPMIGAPCCPNGMDTQAGPGAAEDDDGHGTSVAGIVTSDGLVAPPGVAPDAGVIAVRVLGPLGGAFSDIAAGLDWVLLNLDAYAHPIRVVNMSLGDSIEHGDPGSSPCTGSNTADAIAALHAAGVAVFVASGNDGFDGGLAFPACVPDAISVGGVYDANLGTVSWCAPTGCPDILCTDTATADSFVCHSNSDANLDLLAPDFRTRASTVGGGVITNFAGTSAASPYAAGQGALLLAEDPSLTPGQVLAALVATGATVTNPDNGLSFPRSDVGDALVGLLGDCGNGALEPGEDCDDGGTEDGDCCSSTCAFEPVSSPCGDDGDACTTVHGCDGAGTCVGVTPPVCDDGNACTDDSCDSETGCVFAPNSDPCDDGNVCTGDDACDAGACEGGSPLACDDGDACTAESCDETFGCVSTPIPDCVPEVPMLPGDLLLLLAGALAAGGRAAARRVRA